MAKVKVPEGTVATVFVVAKGEAFEFDIDSELSNEALGAVLHEAADIIEDKNDRAVGAWGRR
jgi:hypothetical protein